LGFKEGWRIDRFFVKLFILEGEYRKFRWAGSKEGGLAPKYWQKGLHWHRMP
jgi:hypothetical protein